MKHTLINVEEHEVRIAILEDGKLVELFIENPGSRTLVGNIYKGKITDIKPGIQAAFVDIGLPKNAFLHFDDARPEAIEQFLTPVESPAQPEGATEKAPKRKSRSRPSRNQVELLKSGQDIMVQVIKDPISAKGCRVSANVSLPGRYLVSLPYSAHANGGVSRKIEEFSERKRLKSILKEIESEGESYIVRTSGVEQTREEILGDVEQLRKTWRAIVRKAEKARAPELLHNDHDIIQRVARDILQQDVDEIWIDSRPEFVKLSKYIKTVIPELDGRLTLYNEIAGLFDRFDVERQIVQALRRKVWLKSGGTLIFDEMEAMTAIDVNTGKFTGQKNPGKTVLKTNLEAARTIAAQLRLRDIGGLVVVDFIDMEAHEDRKKLVHELNACMKSDRAKHTILSVNEFGLVAMTRKRVRESLKKFYHNECPHCDGFGLLQTEQQIWRAIKREIQIRLESRPRPCLTLRLNPAIKAYINDHHAAEIRKWCGRFRIEIQLLAWQGLELDEFEIEVRKKIRGLLQAVGETRKYVAWQQTSENPYKGKALPSIGAKRDQPTPAEMANAEEMTQEELAAAEKLAEQELNRLQAEQDELEFFAAADTPQPADAPDRPKPQATHKHHRTHEPREIRAPHSTPQPLASQASPETPAQPSVAESDQTSAPADSVPLPPKRSRRRRGGRRRSRKSAATQDAPLLSADQPAATGQSAPPEKPQSAPLPQPAAATEQPAAPREPQAEPETDAELSGRTRRHRRSMMSNARKQKIIERRKQIESRSAPQPSKGNGAPVHAVEEHHLPAEPAEIAAVEQALFAQPEQFRQPTDANLAAQGTATTPTPETIAAVAAAGAAATPAASKPPAAAEIIHERPAARKFGSRRQDRRAAGPKPGFAAGGKFPAPPAAAPQKRGEDLLDRIYAVVKAKYENPATPAQTPAPALKPVPAPVAAPKAAPHAAPAAVAETPPAVAVDAAQPAPQIPAAATRTAATPAEPARKKPVRPRKQQQPAKAAKSAQPKIAAAKKSATAKTATRKTAAGKTAAKKNAVPVKPVAKAAKSASAAAKIKPAAKAAKKALPRKKAPKKT